MIHVDIENWQWRSLKILKILNSAIQMQQTPTFKIAQQAFDHLAQGWSTGEFQPYIDMLSDQVKFWIPVGKQRNTSFGYESKEQIIARLWRRKEKGDRLTFSPPDRVTSNDKTVTFEFESQGTIANQPFKGRNAISFNVKNGKISDVREYFGDID
ncbi:nuclear transport factor 2 family protein [Halotia branconii]|uniref:Nuclear transport factor 2 family protein n=1 Tax=Halotia branconii CENA392 TaxID=1539056 RepID=A0AAJ6NNG6_9CYAN|nr:nuclear transport factor 2 family protein [Halotia branconii]WGV23633.1 nuclear transport factor 2 family protein [Halotia branconii CENA392]